MKIGAKLVLCAAVPAAFIWAIGLYGASVSQDSLRHAIEQASATQARTIMEEIDRNVRTRVTEWKAYVRSPIVQQTLQFSNDAFEAMNDRESYIEDQDRKWRAAPDHSFGSLADQLIDSALSEDLQTHLNILEQEHGFPVFGEVFITNRYGVNVAQSNRTTDYLQSDEEWWQTAKRDGAHVGTVSFDDSSKVNSTDLCIRISDERGRFIGVLKAVLNIKEAIEIVNARTINSDGKPFHATLLVSSEGEIIHRTGDCRSDLKKGLAELIPSAPQAANGIAVRDFEGSDGKQHLVAYARSEGPSESSRTGWTLLIERPTREMLQAATDLRKSILWKSAVATALALVIGIGLAASLSRRVRMLVGAACELGRGNLDVEASVSGKDELSTLATEFNRMVCSMRERSEQIVKQAAEMERHNDKLLEEVCERAFAEQALKESERRARAIFDQTYQFTGLMEPDGTLVDVNRSALALGDIDEQSVIGKLFWETPWWKHSPQLQEQLRAGIEAAAKGEFVRFEATHPESDGKLRHVDFSLKPVVDDSGDVTLIIPEGHDITERKRAEEHTQRQSALLDAINFIFKQALTCEKDDELAAACLAAAEELTKSQFGFTAELDKEGTLVNISTTSAFCDAYGLPKTSNQEPPKTMKPRGIILEKVVVDGQSVIVNDGCLADDLGLPETYTSVTSFLGVPIKRGGKTIGMIGLANKESGYDKTDREAAEALSTAFAEAILRKQAELSVRRSEAGLKEAQRIAKLGNWDWDVHSGKMECSDEVCRMLDLSPGELGISRDQFTSRIHPDDRDRVEKAIDHTLATREPYKSEHRILLPDGSERFVHERAELAQDSSETSVRMVGMVHDITERKRAEEQRSQALERRSSLNELQQMLLGVGSLSDKLTRITEDVVRLFEADFCRIWITKPGDRCDTGCPHAEVSEGPHVCRHRSKCLHLSASSGRYTHTEDGVHARVPFGCYKIGRVASAEDRGFVTNEVTVDPRVHNHEWAKELGLVSFAGYQLRPPDGETTGVLALFSKRKIMPEDAALLEGIALTAAQVIDRAESEEQQKALEVQLVQAHKLESIGQLAAGIAHEINTPTQYVGDNTRFLKDGMDDMMEIINCYSSLLNSPEDPRPWAERKAAVQAELDRLDFEFLVDEIPKAIEQSLEGVERVATIVKSMKEFSHPGSDDKQLVDLNRAIESTITVARNEWKYVAEMVTQFDPKLTTVPCLVGDFNQVILNMIVNAAHAIKGVVGDTGEKGTITVATQKDGQWVEIRISDTGTGIPDEVRAKIFDPFFTTKEVGKGTGQGLAIASNVISQKHDGEIKVESVVGEGTTFIIRLPLEPTSTDKQSTERHEEAQPVY